MQNIPTPDLILSTILMTPLMILWYRLDYKKLEQTKKRRREMIENGTWIDTPSPQIIDVFEEHVRMTYLDYNDALNCAIQSLKIMDKEIAHDHYWKKHLERTFGIVTTNTDENGKEDYSVNVSKQCGTRTKKAPVKP